MSEGLQSPRQVYASAFAGLASSLFCSCPMLAHDHTLEEPPNHSEGRQSTADSSKVLLPAFSLGSELVEEGLCLISTLNDVWLLNGS